MKRITKSSLTLLAFTYIFSTSIIPTSAATVVASDAQVPHGPASGTAPRTNKIPDLYSNIVGYAYPLHDDKNDETLKQAGLDYINKLQTDIDFAVENIDTFNKEWRGQTNNLGEPLMQLAAILLPENGPSFCNFSEIINKAAEGVYKEYRGAQPAGLKEALNAFSKRYNEHAKSFINSAGGWAGKTGMYLTVYEAPMPMATFDHLACVSSVLMDFNLILDEMKKRVENPSYRPQY